MRLNYYKVKEKLLEERIPPDSFLCQLKSIDDNLDIAFNRLSGRWEIYRKSNGTYHWILEVSNEDGSYRPLDNRTIRKIYEMDIILRYGSVTNFEKYMDELQAKYRSDIDKESNHKLKWDIKDDKVLWQRATENAQRGLINDLPEEKSKKIISYSK